MTVAEATIVKGIDARQLESFNKQYTASPEKFVLGLQAKTMWEGRGLGNLGKVGPWTLGGQPIVKPTRDFSVQLGSWKEVGDAIGVEGADDRIEPVEAALLALSSCVTEAITLNCARTGVPLEGLEVTANMDVDPGPIIGVKDPSDWKNSLKEIRVNVTARGKLSERDRKMVEEGATRSPVHHIFSSGKQVRTTFRYEA
ncbi:MAG: OsmC family protein [Acidobacteria bacterium]|nr:OsmC family protein [Acidobacteriota bacterium]